MLRQSYQSCYHWRFVALLKNNLFNWKYHHYFSMNKMNFQLLHQFIFSYLLNHLQIYNLDYHMDLVFLFNFSYFFFVFFYFFYHLCTKVITLIFIFPVVIIKMLPKITYPFKFSKTKLIYHQVQYFNFYQIVMYYY